jgi:hypothetical protein
MKRVRYVVGRVERRQNLVPDERVIFAEDCTSWAGDINGQGVKVESCYNTTADVDGRNPSPMKCSRRFSALSFIVSGIGYRDTSMREDALPLLELM